MGHAVVTIAPIVLSIIALYVSLKDRPARLILKAREGNWYTLRQVNTSRGQEIMFEGIVEIYNASSRANAIRAYKVIGRPKDGVWSNMECEYSWNSPADGTKAVVCNETPLTLAPYSGAEARILAFARVPRPYEMNIRIEVEDLFGKQYSVGVTAYS